MLRKFFGKSDFCITFIGVLYSIFTIWSNSFAMMMTTQRNAVHLGFVLIMLFLISIRNRTSKILKVVDGLLMTIGLFCIGYFYYIYPYVHSIRGDRVRIMV